MKFRPEKGALLLFTLILVLAGCQVNTAEGLVQDLEQAINSGDLDEAAGLFGDHAFVTITPPRPCSPGVYTGIEKITDWLDSSIAINTQLVIDVLEADDNSVSARTEYVDDDIKRIGINQLVANEEYIIREGQISNLNIAFTEESIAELEAAAGSTEMITAECLIGIWTGHVLYQFREDGTYAVDESKSRLEESPVDFGLYELEGTALSFQSSENSTICPGQGGSYELSLTEDGRLLFTLIEDACFMRTQGFEHDYGKFE